jgi:hypothetical protein
MKRHGYARWQEIDAEVRALSAQEKVLGKLEDGVWECEIVRLSPITRDSFELTIKHGQRIMSLEVNKQMVRLLEWATGFGRPVGGVALFSLKNGKIDEVGQCPDRIYHEEEEESLGQIV